MMAECLHSLEILVDADFDADALIRSDSRLCGDDHPRHQLGLTHERTADALLDRPRLRTAAVEVHAAAERRDHLRGAGELGGI